MTTVHDTLQKFRYLSSHYILGFDDLFCVDASGNLRIWQNVPLTTSPLTTSWVGSTNVDMAAKPGYPQARVRIADIDGDGMYPLPKFWCVNE